VHELVIIETGHVDARLNMKFGDVCIYVGVEESDRFENRYYLK